MQTIHIDKYDAAKTEEAKDDSVPSPIPWNERLLRGGAEIQRGIGSAARKVAGFVKAKPGAVAVAALGVGLFAARGKHRLLKAAYGALALPYLKRQLGDAAG